MEETAATPRRVTIVDVAKHANVSTTTVSKVLRNAYGASPAMRARVRESMAALGYRPYAAARGMRGQTYTIGIIVPDIRNPFFAEILDGLNGRLHETDYQVLLGTSGNSVRTEARVSEAMIDRGMDAVVMAAPVSPRRYLEEVARALPTVVIGRHGQSAAYDTVAGDDTAGAALIVNHLAGLGHRRIAHIEHHETDATRLKEMPNAVRAQGYRQAMAARGLTEQIDIASTSYTRQGGYLGTLQLLQRPLPPTAIFAGADIVAMGVLEALDEAGLSVPGDISVAGYDNTMFADFSPVSLTTIDQAGREIGADTARLLLERFTERTRPTTQIKLSPTLVIRHTTAPPPADAARRT